MSKKKTYSSKVHIGYAVGDFLIRVKNSAMAGRKEICAPYTKLVFATANVLKDLGYLIEVKKNAETVTVKLAYQKKEPILMNIELVSRPGLRRYMNVKELMAYRGPAEFIVSTNEGVMSSGGAIKKRASGEVIAKVW